MGLVPSRWGAVLAVLLLVAALTAGGPVTAGDRAGERKVVLELFTSQGCSSCPTADRLLAQLLETRGDVIGFSFHVDYWNYIGWKDRFATAQTTARQRAYADALGIAYVYTPQLVLDGARHVLGSDRDAVTAAIEKAHGDAGPHVPVRLTRRGEGLGIEIGGADFDGTAAVWLVVFDRRHVTDVQAGENRGLTLVNHHVVRWHRRIGTWSGGALTLEVGPEEPPRAPGAAGHGWAVLVQEGGGAGRIIGAETLWNADPGL